MPRHFDHVDLRVTSFAATRAFYEVLLPALGFTRADSDDRWIQYEAADEGGVTSFFGVTEDPAHVPNATRIAFWAPSRADVDRLASRVRELGARNVEGPGFEAAFYYAVFFEDPCGNRLEVCHRTANGSEAGPDDAFSQPDVS